ncbi:hypothetical protein AAC387_Pa01g4431 [Persea americana]
MADMFTSTAPKLVTLRHVLQFLDPLWSICEQKQCIGSESVVYEARFDGTKVALKKPILFTSNDLDKFHKELQPLCTLEHLRLATLVAAHVRPTNYMFFFQFYERRNLAEKLHVEEWSPSVEEVLTISIQLVIWRLPLASGKLVIATEKKKKRK